MRSNRRPTLSTRRRWILRGVFVALLLLVLPLLLGPGRPPADAPVALPAMSAADSARIFAVYVADYGYHTAIIVQLPASYAPALAGLSGDSVYLEYAWGDRRFFMESRFAPWSIFASLFLPTEAVMYLAVHARPPSQRGGWRDLRERRVNSTQLVALIRSLEQWAVRDSSGQRAAEFPAVPAYAGRFHRALGRYSWWFNCNWWTVRNLSAIDLANPSLAVFLPRDVHKRLERFVSSAP